MFELVLMQIGPSPNASIDNMRKAFSTGNLRCSKERFVRVEKATAICSLYLQSSIECSLNSDAFRCQLPARCHCGYQCVELVLLILELLHQTRNDRKRLLVSKRRRSSCSPFDCSFGEGFTFAVGSLSMAEESGNNAIASIR